MGCCSNTRILTVHRVYSATTVDDLKWLYATLNERRKQFKLNTFYRIMYLQLYSYSFRIVWEKFDIKIFRRW